MASTRPLAGSSLATPGKGLVLGIDAACDLHEQLELLAVLRFLAYARLVANVLLQQHPVLLQQCMKGLQIAEQHTAFERRQRAALEPRAPGEIDVERRRRCRLERQPQRLAPLVELARRSIRAASARGCRDRRASAPISSGTGARSSWESPMMSRRTGSRSNRSEQARENGAKSSVHFAGDQRSQR